MGSLLVPLSFLPVMLHSPTLMKLADPSTQYIWCEQLMKVPRDHSLECKVKGSLIAMFGALTGGPSEPGMPGSPGFPRGPCRKTDWRSQELRSHQGSRPSLESILHLSPHDFITDLFSMRADGALWPG